MNHDRPSPCEFCLELTDPSKSRFYSIYHAYVKSRLLCNSLSVVAMPTIGQMFEGSMLVLPRAHVATLAMLSPTEREEVLSIADIVCMQITEPSRFVMFEHGAREGTGASCGIYHAHLHVVPVPGPIRLTDVLPPDARRKDSVAVALSSLGESREYLLFCDTDGSTAVHEPIDSSEFPSQYFRQRLHLHFGCARSWDWRAYSEPEEDLLKVLTRHGWTSYECTHNNGGNTRVA